MTQGRVTGEDHQVEAWMPSWTKEKGGVVVWAFKAEEGSSDGDGKQMFTMQIFAEPSLTMRHRENLPLLGFPSLSH